MPKLVIGITGETAAGKEDFGKHCIRYITKKTGSPPKRFTFSSVLKQLLETLGLELTTENMQIVAQMIDDKRYFGAGTLSQAAFFHIINAEEDIVVIDGIRWLTDETMIRKLPNSVIVYVTASAKTRWHRARKRAEKPGEASMTWEAFKKQDGAPNEVRVPNIGSRADHIVDNNGTKTDLVIRSHAVLEEIFANMPSP